MTGRTRLSHTVRCAALSWLLACLPGPQAAIHSEPHLDRSVNPLTAALRHAGIAPAVLARHAPLQPATALTFNGFFRSAPAAGMTALEDLSAGLRRSASAQAFSPAAALRQTLTLGYGALGQPAPAFPAIPDTGHAWPPDMSDDLRSAIQDVLAATARAEAWRRKALAAWPSNVSAADLWRQFASLHGDGAIPTHAAAAPEPVQALVDAVDHRTLTLGMAQLVSAVDSLQRRLQAARPRPSAWQFDTAMGRVLVDTTDSCNVYRGRQPLLLIDTGGDDTYVFDDPGLPGTTVLLDLRGNDLYAAPSPDRDPSSATLGYAVLWDGGGDDLHQGGWLTQGAALFGAAMLVDAGGDDRYEAQGMAQGFALGGLAVLLDRDGDDHYRALTQAQASAGPGGLALLADGAGDDDYLLAAVPLVSPSAQLKDRNASLGQGTAFGLRPPAGQAGPAAPGGLALLVDNRGDDRYNADVFAQGAGYEGGMGVLMDGGGNNQVRAAWYSMGAAAHQATGVFVASGTGRSSHTVSHATSLGAAHDDSLAVFIGGAGDDAYLVGTLGMGAAHDGSTAVFLDRGGNDRYSHTGEPCRAFGASAYSDAAAAPEPRGEAVPPPPNTAFFFDLSGADRYSAHCAKAGTGAKRSRAGTKVGSGGVHGLRTPFRRNVPLA